LNWRDSRGETPLIWAVKYGNDRMVELFLEQQEIKPNLANQDGRTALSFAAESGNEGAVRLLLRQGDVDSNSPDNRDRTPLSFADSGGHEGVVKLIRERTELNSNPPPNSSRTRRWYAPRYGILRTPKPSPGYGSPTSRPLGTSGPVATSVRGGDALGRQVAGLLPAPEDVTPQPI